jgi:[ribosomal protein S18]-alanine N-acetyltransferase
MDQNATTHDSPCGCLVMGTDSKDRECRPFVSGSLQPCAKYNRFMKEAASKDDCLIRSYRQTDLPELHRIDQICFEGDIAFTKAEMLFYLTHPKSIIAVAERGDGIVGFAVGQMGGQASAHIFTLDVIPEARRKKVGTRLIESLHQAFRDKNMRIVDLEVSTKNRAAQCMYEKLQYYCVGVLPGYYNGREDAYRMMLIL